MPHRSGAPRWDQIDTVLIDMDGTLLDLGFDNWFWGEYLPAHWAGKRGCTLADAIRELQPRFAAAHGRLDWYCIDFWSRELELDLRALTHAAGARVRWIPGAEEFLERLGRLGKWRVLLTNAHPATLAIKDSFAGVVPRLDAAYSSHDFGAPKEHPDFWPRFAAARAFDRARTLLVDDNVAVLAAARDYGIGWLCEIRRPDLQRPARTAAEFHGVDSIAELA
jgi:HAD superfamily hydrolase (TIGR01509 family)